MSEEELKCEKDGAWLSKHLGFVGDPNQINVAITRCKQGLCIIGNLTPPLSKLPIWHGWMSGWMNRQMNGRIYDSLYIIFACKMIGSDRCHVFLLSQETRSYCVLMEPGRNFWNITPPTTQ